MIHDLSAFRQLILEATSLEPVFEPDLTQIRGHIRFVDSSILHVRENYIKPINEIDYAYHWQTADHQLIRRWDNAHPVDLPTSPHHQHVGSQGNVQPSGPMTLETVLRFIESSLISD